MSSYPRAHKKRKEANTPEAVHAASTWLPLRKQRRQQKKGILPTAGVKCAPASMWKGDEWLGQDEVLCMQGLREAYSFWSPWLPLGATGTGKRFNGGLLPTLPDDNDGCILVPQGQLEQRAPRKSGSLTEMKRQILKSVSKNKSKIN